MTQFPDVDKIHFAGPHSESPLAFHYYDRNRVVRGKRMEEHTRFAVCFWHSFCWPGSDVFGAGSFGSVASSSTLAVSIPASAVPSAASAAFSSMSAAAGVVAGGMAPGAVGVGAGAGIVNIVPAALAIGAAVAVGATVQSKDNPTVTHNP